MNNPLHLNANLFYRTIAKMDVGLSSSVPQELMLLLPPLTLPGLSRRAGLKNTHTKRSYSSIAASLTAMATALSGLLTPSVDSTLLVSISFSVSSLLLLSIQLYLTRLLLLGYLIHSSASGFIAYIRTNTVVILAHSILRDASCHSISKTSSPNMRHQAKMA